MEFSRREEKAVEAVINTKDEAEITELSELHLAIVGGGTGEVIFG
jgi:hypothetical protein